MCPAWGAAVGIHSHPTNLPCVVQRWEPWAAASWSPLAIGVHHQGLPWKPWLHHCPPGGKQWINGTVALPLHTPPWLQSVQIWSPNFECVMELAINIRLLPASDTLPALKKEGTCAVNSGSCSTATVRHLRQRFCLMYACWLLLSANSSQGLGCPEHQAGSTVPHTPSLRGNSSHNACVRLYSTRCDSQPSTSISLICRLPQGTSVVCSWITNT